MKMELLEPVAGSSTRSSGVIHVSVIKRRQEASAASPPAGSPDTGWSIRRATTFLQDGDNSRSRDLLDIYIYIYAQ
jgi:hypothetical protein